jgi:hypothetical protein
MNDASYTYSVIIVLGTHAKLCMLHLYQRMQSFCRLCLLSFFTSNIKYSFANFITIQVVLPIVDTYWKSIITGHEIITVKDSLSHTKDRIPTII